MPTNYFVNARRILKQQLLEFIRSHPNMRLKKVLALFSMKTGLKMSTLETYVVELKEAELLFEKEKE